MIGKTVGKTDKNLKNEKMCPTCGASVTADSRPFCSKRCADVDLGRWLQGAYAIPAFDSADDSIVDAELAVSDSSRQSELNKISD